MELIVNGSRYTFEGQVSVTEMLEILEIRSSRVAVELNRKIVGKGDYGATILRDGDRIEVVHFVGGG